MDDSKLCRHVCAIGDNETQLAFSAWICWAGPLLITEVLLQGKKIFRPVGTTS